MSLEVPSRLGEALGHYGNSVVRVFYFYFHIESFIRYEKLLDQKRFWGTLLFMTKFRVSL